MNSSVSKAEPSTVADVSAFSADPDSPEGTSVLAAGGPSAATARASSTTANGNPPEPL